ncbi:hypothetical protein A0123_00594 [Gluconobacter cerinus]|uniref:Uncharacterized protein n=1 Tax=Gluconobacter cerinus TaxID=38307 RepID=A0A1B6VPA4_9PROT|nr:hypothetical protein A0123_00594 [Gluconobacter cerinus]
MENENDQDSATEAMEALARIDAAMVGLARLRAQAGVYEYIPAARLTTRLTGIILQPTLLAIQQIPRSPAVNRALEELLVGLERMGVISDHDVERLSSPRGQSNP